MGGCYNPIVKRIQKGGKKALSLRKGTVDGEAIELAFMEKDLCIVKEHEGTHAGTWSIDSDGNALMTFEDAKVIATLTKQGPSIARENGGSDAAVFEKMDKKN